MFNRLALMVITVFLSLPSCTPTVKVEAPDKPIEINLNVNIEHNVKVKIDKDLEKAMSANPGVF